MAPVVSADSVSKTFGRTVALEEVSVEVDTGEVFCLIGPNGAGKTTLVRSITGTLQPDSGTIRLFGDPLSRLDTSRIGVLPQSFTPPRRLTAAELIDYYGGLYDVHVDTEDILDIVGLADVADRRYEHLSGGQQRRVCVGTTIVHDPDLLFLDEPTTGIDPAGRRRLWNVIESLVDGGTTVFLTTHDMHEAEYFADHVGMLSAGSLIVIGSPDELIATYGGTGSVTIETSVPRRLADALSRQTTVRDSSIRVDNVSDEDLGTLVEELRKSNLSYEAFRWSKPGLEDVYLRLADNSTLHDRAESDVVTITEQ